MWLPPIRTLPSGTPDTPLGRLPSWIVILLALALLAGLIAASQPLTLLAALLLIAFWSWLARFNPWHMRMLYLALLLLALVPAAIVPTRETLLSVLLHAARTLGAMTLILALWNAVPRSRWPERIRSVLDRLEHDLMRLQLRLRTALLAHAFRSGGQRAGPLFWLKALPDILALLYVESRLAPGYDEGNSKEEPKAS